ncbi:MAG: hypothetical protein AAGK23_04385 [Pseudomonadota bacterium]
MMGEQPNQYPKSKLKVSPFNPFDREDPSWKRAERFLARRKNKGSIQADICHGRLILNSEVEPAQYRGVSGALLLHSGWGGDRVVGAGLVELPEDRSLAHMPTEIDMFSRYPWLSGSMKRVLIGGQMHALRQLGDIESFNMPYRLDEPRRFAKGVPSSRNLAREIRSMGSVTPAMDRRYIEYASHLMRTRDFGILSISHTELRALERDYLDWIEQSQTPHPLLSSRS